MRTILITSLIVLLWTCSSNNEPANTTPTQAPQQTNQLEKSSASKTDSSSTLGDYLEAESIAAIRKIEQVFNEGFVKGSNNPDIIDAYEYHALRLKLDFLNQESFLGLYPYNGKFNLNSLTAEASRSGILTDKCGFVSQETNSTLHYFCLDASDPYFDFLAALGTTNPYIKEFQERYQEIKAIDPALQQLIFIRSEENLDFNNPDHRLFYMLIHITLNEELIALRKVQGN